MNHLLGGFKRSSLRVKKGDILDIFYLLYIDAYGNVSSKVWPEELCLVGQIKDLANRPASQWQSE